MPLKDLEWQRYHISLPDGGPFYTETHPGDFIVEPWNAVSSLFFLIPAIFWAIKIRGNLKENVFLAYCIPLLVLGGLGSTFYHAFRTSYFFLLMDIMPILLLTFSVSSYFWQKVYNNWWLTILTVIVAFFGREMVYSNPFIAIHTRINIAYTITGIVIFLPIMIVLIKTRFKNLRIVLVSVLLFMLSLFFREIDARSFQALPMGTHFLWHIFSAAAAHYLAEYLFYIKNIELKKVKFKKADSSLLQNCQKVIVMSESSVTPIKN